MSFSCSEEDVKISNEANFQKPSGVISQERDVKLSESLEVKSSTLFSKAGNAKFDDEVKLLRWSLEDLHNYLNYAENTAKEKGYNMTGVRVYFAIYPEKRGQNTLFFAPTGYKSTSKASMFTSFFIAEEEVVPVDPLNDGNGGYPQ